MYPKRYTTWAAVGITPGFSFKRLHLNVVPFTERELSEGPLRPSESPLAAARQRRATAAGLAMATHDLLEHGDPAVIDTFKSPRTGQTVSVRARDGESRSAAIQRVKAKHGA